MVQRIQLPRLSKADVEGLMRAHQFVEQLVAALKQTNWAGAGACVSLAGNVDIVICQIYNKAEAAILGKPASSSPEPAGEPPTAISTGDDADQVGKTPPGGSEG
jgi:hypothetical protein